MFSRTDSGSPENNVTGIPSPSLIVVGVPVEKKLLLNLKIFSDITTFFNSIQTKLIVRYIRLI